MDKALQLRTIADQTKRKQGMLLQEFLDIFELTQDEPDFPRKLLKYYNVTSEEKLTDRDILLLIGKCFEIKPKLLE